MESNVTISNKFSRRMRYRIYLRLCDNHSHPPVLCIPVFDVPESPSHTSPSHLYTQLSGLAWTRTICNKLALSKSIMATPGQNIFKLKPLSAGHKDGTVTSQRLFRKHNNAFTDIGPFTCNLRSSNRTIFHLSQRSESRQNFLSFRKLTEWRTVTTGVLLSYSLHGRIGQKEMSMVS